jgi:YjbE family integral membrane protein
MSITDPAFWGQLLSIVVSDLLLAGDNALVIALAVRTLPRRQQWWGRVWGTIGAVALRLLFITIMTFLLSLPLLQFVGGILLIWIAIKLVRQGAGEAGADAHQVRQGGTLLQAIWIIIVADVVMSLDNVLAIAAIGRENLGLVAFGIGLSIPIVVFGSAFLAWLMGRFTWIVWLGGGILGYYSGKLILEDRVVHQILGDLANVLHYPLPIFLGVLLTVLGWWFAQGPGRAERVHGNG